MKPTKFFKNHHNNGKFFTDKIYNYEVVLVPDSEKGFTGWFRDYPGIIAEGNSRDEVLDNLIEAQQFALEWAKEELNKKEIYCQHMPDHQILALTGWYPGDDDRSK